MDIANQGIQRSELLMSGTRLEFTRVNDALSAVDGAVLLGFEPALPSYALRWLVSGG